MKVYKNIMKIRQINSQIEYAVELLKAGELVAFPTETVYGLGADAGNQIALNKIFKVKGRPKNHPLILHIASISQIENYAVNVPDLAYKLAEKFWPGPLTLILERGENTSKLLTGQQDTVALRIPNHPVALALLEGFGGAIAAPSANRFGRISPTTAKHVEDEFGKNIALILDGGASQVGLESTILNLSSKQLQILRPGQVSSKQLAKLIGYQPLTASQYETTIKSPGMLKSHYSPLTPSSLKSRIELQKIIKKQDTNIGIICHSIEPDGLDNSIKIENNPATYAQKLYASLRQLDRLDLNHIYIEEPESNSDWLAIKDRLLRATQ